MERSAADDDVIACPLCRTRDGLTAKWIPELDHRVHERTEIGCATCDRWFSAKEDRWAIAEWNNFAIEEWRHRGVDQPNDECIYNGDSGTLVEVNATAKTASISVHGEVRLIRNLTKLYVPLTRFKAGGI
jgi:hypothetical protein